MGTSTIVAPACHDRSTNSIWKPYPSEAIGAAVRSASRARRYTRYPLVASCTGSPSMTRA
jgi:hypothetical protein